MLGTFLGDEDTVHPRQIKLLPSWGLNSNEGKDERQVSKCIT